ncbi:hypothetical protein WJX72_011071 [[Myrmecia] bisecta]|uniref:SET domain-containing protein n=1 Tax=[Myrmecia] bisecta TaxID=41462 RepID=A0AAW1PV62_9CHLO
MALSPLFLEWLAKHGVKQHNISGAHVDGLRGVVATADIEPDTVILEVPESLLMTAHSARQDTVLNSTLHSHGQGLSAEQVLAVHLLHEVSKGETSFWAPYLQQLPHSYTTLAHFSPEACEALQCPYARSVAHQAVQQQAADWQQAKPVLKALGLPPKWRSKKAWLWASATVSSRTMYVPFCKGGALTPFGDLHNYCPPPPNALPHIEGMLPPLDEAQERASLCGDGGYDPDSQVYRLHARRRYQGGEQVFLCYGKHTNLELLEHYGFLLPETNPHDTALIAASHFHKGDKPVLSEAHAAAACFLHWDGRPAWKLLQLLREAAATPTELKQGRHLVLAGERVSKASDLRALGLLQDACLRALTALPTTVDQDMTLLEGLGGGDECMRLVIEWRISQKR